MPRVQKHSIISPHILTFLFTKGISSLRQRPNTKSTWRPFGKSFPIPNRNRGYWLVPNDSWILFKPLWPASEPFFFILTAFNGKAKSSTTTNKCSMGIFSTSSQYLTARPLKFIYVEGLIKTNFRPLMLISHTSAKRSVRQVPRCLAANTSNTSNPILWRVSTYSAPMFPNPAIKNFIVTKLSENHLAT